MWPTDWAGSRRRPDGRPRIRPRRPRCRRRGRRARPRSAAARPAPRPAAWPRRPGPRPSPPMTSKVSGRDWTTESSAIRISEVTISSKGTWSLGLAGQDLVDDGDRPHPALRLEQRHPPAARRQPAGLEPQQGRDGLEVVLDPVVHLPDGRVLGQQQPVEPADVGHVAQQHQAPGHHVVGQQGDAVEQHGHVGPSLHLLDHREGRGQGPFDGRLLDAQVGEAAALDLRVHPHPVEGVGGVGRGVAHPALLVDQDDPVTRPAGPPRWPPPRSGTGRSTRPA